jgi:hypothetical protein
VSRVENHQRPLRCSLMTRMRRGHDVTVMGLVQVRHPDSLFASDPVQVLTSNS